MVQINQDAKYPVCINGITCFFDDLDTIVHENEDINIIINNIYSHIIKIEDNIYNYNYEEYNYNIIKKINEFNEIKNIINSNQNNFDKIENFKIFFLCYEN
jgi:hypothetical protein